MGGRRPIIRRAVIGLHSQQSPADSRERVAHSSRPSSAPGGTEPSWLVSQERALTTGPGTPWVAETLRPASGKAAPQQGAQASWLQDSGRREVCCSLIMTYLGKERSSACAKGVCIAGGCVQDRLHGFPAEGPSQEQKTVIILSLFCSFRYDQ